MSAETGYVLGHVAGAMGFVLRHVSAVTGSVLGHVSEAIRFVVRHMSGETGYGLGCVSAVSRLASSMLFLSEGIGFCPALMFFLGHIKNGSR